MLSENISSWFIHHIIELIEIGLLREVLNLSSKFLNIKYNSYSKFFIINELKLR